MAMMASQAARETALVVRENARELLRISGKDRATWLNGVVTCDVLGVKPGEAAFGLLLSKLGKIQSDFYLLATEQELLLALAPGTKLNVSSDLERMLVMEDAELLDPSTPLECLVLHGPRALELGLAAARRDGVLAGSLDRTGLGGVVLLVPEGSRAAVEAELEAQGAVLADAEGWQAVRLERRLGVFGTDYGPADNPHEAALDRAAVSWSKGCYLGQEVVFMQDARGKLKRRLALVELGGEVPAAGAAVLGPDGAAVGEVTSAAQSAVLGSPLALIRARAPHYEPGARLAIGGQTAVVRSDPV